MVLKKDEIIRLSFLKRLTDIFFSLFILLFLLPLIVIIIISFLIEMFFSKKARGPIFYCEKRISAGKEINFCKFRTCYQFIYDKVKREQGTIRTSLVEAKKDNFLKTGWILKKIYLDEVPQLISVLKGDLTLIGPRPKPVFEYRKFYLEQGIYTKTVFKAGLTGLYQSYKGHFTKTDVQMDTEYLEYIRDHSPVKVFIYDFKIILRTIRVMLEHKGV